MLVSFQLPSKYPENLRRLLDNLEATCDDLASFEVLVKVDAEDASMRELVLREQETRLFSLRPLISPRGAGYPDLWKAVNDLFRMTDPRAYFVCCLNDELKLVTKGWDANLRRYVGLFPDHIFRLRTSRFKFRNYFDFWECGYAPEGLGFYTRRWLEITEGWSPCFGPDNSQQYIAYYLARGNDPGHYQFNRDVPILDIHWEGEGVALNLNYEQRIQRTATNIRLWFRQVSHPMQEELFRRARRLQGNIMSAEFFADNAVLVEEPARKTILLIDKETKTLLYILSYRISRVLLLLRNLKRTLRYSFYGGGGRHAYSPVPIALWELLCYSYPNLRHARDNFAEKMSRARRAGLVLLQPALQSLRWIKWVAIFLARSIAAKISLRTSRNPPPPRRRDIVSSYRLKVMYVLVGDFRSLSFVRAIRRLSWAFKGRDLRWLLVKDVIEKDLRGPV